MSEMSEMSEIGETDEIGDVSRISLIPPISRFRDVSAETNTTQATGINHCPLGPGKWSEE